VRILLVRLSALGDVALALHVLAAARARCPEGHIGWLVEDRFAPLLDGHPQLNRLHVYERRRSPLPWRLVTELRRERYDLALDLQGNLKSGVLARLAGARRTVGLDAPLSREGNRLFVRERVLPRPGHRLESHLGLLDAVVGAGPRAPARLPAAGEAHGAIVLHPGASRFGAFKRWPVAAFAELGDRLGRRLGARVILTAGPGERADADDVRRRMTHPAEVKEPKGLRPLADLLHGARLFVAADTGPAHIAAALGVPTLTLFGPKDPRLLAPVGPRAKAVRAGVRCSPCALRFCPDPVCMTALPVDLVERSALELLGVP
jgi:3-deoxy-D-manno-octulosonic-acid transferase/heptosyltransferase-1